ncbi:hypothetical protein I317_03199 [Kwoniella heveanensis CBS 569]|uniref:Uncharacterized protein n=1 Tax=Kwoniella heveanensis BCC8398 TaxID=1296120 RepID=A0A1B9GXJ5_9TREE|nr:hypothetical protein I316_02730 [Kwoniella heveanensis BCC8398]OCF42978.1 hypothetical protein I317_03199 [Kwoniella heveanensis CBS 569]
MATKVLRSTKTYAADKGGEPTRLGEKVEIIDYALAEDIHWARRAKLCLCITMQVNNHSRSKDGTRIVFFADSDQQ